MAAKKNTPDLSFSDVEAAKKYRSIKKMLFTKKLNSCKDIVSDEEKIESKMYSDLERLHAELLAAHEAVLLFLDIEEIEKDVFLDASEKDYEVITKSKNIVEKSTVKLPQSVCEVTKKKVSPPIYDGDIKNYYVWKANFTTNFQSKDGSIAMLQILEALCSDARKKVEHLIIKGSPEAMFEELDHLYGDKRKICKEIMSSVSQIPTCQEVKDFRMMYESIKLALSQLEAIDCAGHLDHFNSVETLEAKLPAEFKLKWAEVAIRDDVTVQNTFKKMLEFIGHSVKLAEQVERMDTLSLKPDPHHKFGHDRNLNSLYQAQAQGGATPWQHQYQHPNIPVQHQQPNFQPYQGFDRQWESYPTNCNRTMYGQLPIQPRGQNTGMPLPMNLNNPCPLHGKPVSHNLSRCIMLKTSHRERQVALLRELRDYCKTCLRKGHQSGECRSTISCFKCQRRHFDFIHDALESIRADDTNPTKCYQTDNDQFGTFWGDAICPTQSAIITSSDSHHPVSVLHDSGSNVSMIREDIAQQLNLKVCERKFLSFTTVSNETVRKSANRYQLFIANTRNPEQGYSIRAFGVPRIGGDLPALPNGIRPAEKALGLSGSEHLDRPMGKLDILIGTDNASCLPDKVKDEQGLIFGRNKLGGVIFGSHKSFSGRYPNHYRATILATTCDVLENEKILDFFSTESLGVEVSVKCGSCKCGNCGIGTDTLTLVEQQQLELVKQGMNYDPVNRIITASYPAIKDLDELGNNLPMVMKSLTRLEKDLLSDKSLAEAFQCQFVNMIERGVVKKLSDTELNQWRGPVNYLPMQYVIKESSLSTPLRIVMDTVRKYQGQCVNDYWPKGPNLINNILALLIRFREGKICFYGDIAKMYQTVHTDVHTWHLHRLLWRNLNTEMKPDTYVVTRNSFGSRPAGLVAILGLHMVANIGQYDYPKGADCIRRQMYVDDCLDSSDTLELAREIMRQVDECLAYGSFAVKEWKVIGNSSSSANEIGKAETLDFGSDDRVLGIKMNTESDCFMFTPRINISKRNKKHKTFSDPDLEQGEILDRTRVPTLTKRTVTSLIMRIFDPMGLLGPFLCCLAMLLSSIWRFRFPDKSEIDWDDKLPFDLDTKFRTTIDKMFDLATIRFPRSLTPSRAVGKPWLITCSDSSTKAFGAVAYVRWKLSDNTFWSRIIAAKYRIWPVKPDDYLSVVRGELQGALLASRIAQFIIQETRLKFEEVVFIVDSEIVRAQIASNSHAFDVFTGRRVAEIRKNSNPEQWFWVSGKENVCADLLTRGTVDCRLLDETSLWQTGPAFLRRDFKDWGLKQPGAATVLKKTLPDLTVQMCNCEACEPEPGNELITIPIQTTCAVSQVLDDELTGTRRRQERLLGMIDVSRFSNLNKLLLATTRAWHFLQWTPAKGKFLEYCIAPSVLGVEALEEAKNMWLRHAQLDLSHRLQSGKLKKMNPFVDEHGIWRANGRFKEGEGYHPIILEFPNPFLKLLAMHIHQRGHNGVTATMAKIRMDYYVLGLHRLATEVRKGCFTCRILDRRTVDVPMSKLPMSRVRPYYPFENISCDICGPFPLKAPYKNTRARQTESYGKGYALIFTCLSSRSVHCEAMEGENTDSFLLAFRRMMAIRGQPRTCWSDNGGQIVAADQELQAMIVGWNKEELEHFGVIEGISWTYSAPGSPWQNGVTEALVKSVRRTLKITLGEGHMCSIMELQTLLYEVASVLNERPITASLLSNAPDIEEGTYLCPNQLLYGRATARIPAGPFRAVDVSSEERFHAIETLVNNWWAKWTADYLPTMLRQSKWFKDGRTVKTGDIVHVRDLNPVRGHWKIAEVIELLESMDGQTRNVKIRYKTPGPMPGGHSTYRGVPSRTQVRDVKNLVVIVTCEERGHCVTRPAPPGGSVQ